MTPAAARLARSMSEAQLQAAVRRMCDHLGVAVNHFEDSRRSWLPGKPDLEILGTSRLDVELKSMTGSPSGAQRRYIRLIQAAGGRVLVWTPEQLLDGTIARELASLSPLPIAAFTADDIERITA